MSEEDIPAKPSFSFDTETPVETTSRQGAEQSTQGVVYRQPFSSSAPAQNTEFPSALNAAGAQRSAPEESNAQSETAGTGLNFWFNNPYSLIPRGWISASISKPEAKTLEEQALYDYGNAVGTHIKTFESTHKNAMEVLKNFFPEKGGFSSNDQTSVNAVISLANDYSQLGNTIAQMGSIPESAQGFHLALAKSYADVGAGLAKIAKTNTGGDITQAILAYDNIAGVFIQNFVALAEFFSARGIKFSGSDAGNVFSFSPGGSL